MKFVVQPIVQAAIVFAIGAIIVAAFATHQTTALGGVLTALSTALGMFFYRSGWLHDAPPAPVVEPAAAEGPAKPSEDSAPVSMEKPMNGAS